MFNLSSRMKLQTSLIRLTALAIVSAAALSTPASAAKQSDVMAACKRTKGCWTETSNGNTFGCSPHACFICEKGKCFQARNSVGEGKKGGAGVGSTAVNVSSTRHTTLSTPTVNRGDPAPVRSGATVNNPGTTKMGMGGKH